MQELKANTQVIVTVGPFVDVGDGFTPQTDITLGGNEAELLKHGSATVVDIAAATWAAVASCRGYYSLTLTTSFTDTEGMLTVIVQDDSDTLPVKQEYMVLSEAAWDSKYVAKDTGFMDVNVKAINDVATTSVTTVKAVQGIAVDGVVTTVTNQLTAAEVATGVWQDTTAGDFTVASSVGKSLYTAGVVPGGTNGLFIAGTNAATAVTTGLTATFTGNLTGSVGSVTGAVGSVTGAVGSVTGAVGSVAGNVDGTVASVTTKTGYALVSTGADLVLKNSTFALAIADAIWDELMAGHTTADTSGLVMNEWQNGGRLDLILDIIAADTTTDIPALLPAALVGGRIDATVDATGMEAGAVATILTTAMTEAYAADGSAPTIAQALCLLISACTEFAISSTTITSKKLDGSTTAATFTLDDATNPTSRTRAT